MNLLELRYEFLNAILDGDEIVQLMTEEELKAVYQRYVDKKRTERRLAIMKLHDDDLYHSVPEIKHARLSGQAIYLRAVSETNWITVCYTDQADTFEVTLYNVPQYRITLEQMKDMTEIGYINPLAYSAYLFILYGEKR